MFFKLNLLTQAARYTLNISPDATYIIFFSTVTMSYKKFLRSRISPEVKKARFRNLTDKDWSY